MWLTWFLFIFAWWYKRAGCLSKLLQIGYKKVHTFEESGDQWLLYFSVKKLANIERKERKKEERKKKRKKLVNFVVLSKNARWYH